MYSIKQIAAAIKGTPVKFSSDATVTRLAFDSRKVIEPSHTLFFAIRGKRHDGHLFLKELYQKGVRNFIVTNPEAAKELREANVIRVDNAIDALQQLAAFHRKNFKYPVIGITGSNGKTIVKEWLFQLLHEDYNIVRSPKSYNSQIGVPLSVWMMNENHTLGIFEAGISMPEEMDGLEEVIRPDLGIFTNIGEAHAEGFLNVRQKVNEKLKLFVNSKILIYSLDYPEITQCITEFKHRLPDKEQDEKFRLFTWSRKGDADLRITKVDRQVTETHIHGVLKGHEELNIVIPFTDEASIENAIHCWATLLYLRMDPAKIRDRMIQLGSISMRLELKDGINNCSIINDSYNSDIRSLAIALDFLDQQHQHPKKTLILSDILQSGRSEVELYTEVRNLLAQREISKLIGIGKDITEQKKLFPSFNGFESAFFETTDDFLKDFHQNNFDNETILLKGARKFEFEKISKLLEQKIHKTVLEIDLNALIHNLQVFQSLLKPGTKVMAMVKAFSYGSGTFEIANVLQYHLVDYLTVAYADEGVELRKAGISLPIMVMNPEARSFETMIRYHLEPEIYSLTLLDKFHQAVELYSPGKDPYSIHIKIDSGMHRLGFTPDEVPVLIAALKKKYSLMVTSVFSHLAASDEPEHDDFTRQQIKRFKKASDELSAGLNYPVIRHILNSGGVVRFPEAHFEMVRLGIGMYGVDTTGKIQDQLQQVSTLKSSVSQVKTVKAGESVGYSRKFVASDDRRIATIGIGYADGVDRRLGNGKGKMLVRGQFAPIIGNVCMDLCMIDVTNISGVEEGDEVIIFGNDLPIQEVAKHAGTIPYEILTGISSRVKRVYFQE